ncbi:tRNA (adenosine(37)-N6)-dimethylallyltransferase MiaA [Candidatus Peregrinibacteria bacterium CG10_big_fil_rev_8_21_14_0_10_49_24]|nr:MAG: tRNA (adenosine(37)-N6)-dimethylallyltransferase MiaA [Candidatus Peregrinibacteria bacterium CG11_big_fil_rev_8_21_14_0_20_49_14]PIR51025.1 MAG: tRNA (adenosine(37)-N6)-dimethylallyltransferase MiaA [Candidatus Peregrinibacteria bacterium CG10_big_fil_rev_8_21_14_0_10_49_24]PJA67578.1 MAG: tRNA (adenosine(37)-N6)-dimethylallyltransferase MiaA [Candidatus Peregrinibacteria bacterium CG_4_9_14_3_um_filter_49_12]
MNSDWKQKVSACIAESSRPLITVVGPTAGGKTDFSLQIATYVAQHCDKKAEIINADSRQLYRYLNIGTAKISKEERQGVPHHLLDVLNPNEETTAGRYRDEVIALIENMYARDVVPVLVGGSMLYVSSIIDGLTLAPPSNPELRERLLAEYESDEGVSLYEKLLTIDPDAAEEIHIHNKPRLVRAIEIFELLSQPKTQAVPPTQLRQEGDSGFQQLIFGMHWERAALYERINTRTTHMFEAGWLEEVEELLRLGYGATDPALKSHGYREIIAYMEGSLDDIDALCALISAKTRQYAKRQQCWWRGDSRIHWITQETPH